MTVAVTPTSRVVAEALTARLVTAAAITVRPTEPLCPPNVPVIVVAVDPIGEGLELEPEPSQPLHRATTTARQAAWRAGMTALSLTTV